jgi:hypothetical protein
LEREVLFCASHMMSTYFRMLGVCLFAGGVFNRKENRLEV